MRDCLRMLSRPLCAVRTGVPNSPPGEGKGVGEEKGGNPPADLVNSENSDRMIIYNALSQKNGAPLEDVQKIYAKRLQDDAPAGTPIEAMNASGRRFA